jgi:hypothetical protein
MRFKLALILCGLLVALSAAVAAQAAEAPSPGGQGGAPKQTEPAPTTEPEHPASPAEPAPEASSSDVEAEEERESREAETLLAAEEAGALRRIEREAAASAGDDDETIGGGVPASIGCLVPSLKGDTLAAARTALSRAHCKLGRVRRPHTAHATLVIVRQARPAGDRLSDGTAVAVRLGVRRRHR